LKIPFHLIRISITLDEPAAESVKGGEKPSKTDTAAPTSEGNIESGCEE